MDINYTSAFNNHFQDFIDDIQSVFPNNVDIMTARNALSAIKKMNPKLLSTIWLSYVYTPYQSQIDAGDIDFFISKDYKYDLGSNANAGKIMEAIDRLRNPVREMEPENQAKTMKYIQNLSKLALLIAHK
jgi:hypothetical protein